LKEKIEEAVKLPQYGEIKVIIDRIVLDIPIYLLRLEEHFCNTEKTVIVSSIAGSPPIQKLVSSTR